MSIVDVASLSAEIHSAEFRSAQLQSAEIRAAEIGPATPLLWDVRWRLGDGSCAGEFEQGHIPGAVFVDLDADLCGPPGPSGRHPLPAVEKLQAALRRYGVSKARRVIVYDGGDGLAAARAWWTLSWAGHDDVRVLDGGWAAWLVAGEPVQTGPAASPPPVGDIVVHPGSLPQLDADHAAVVAREGVLLDARTPPRFRGETEPIDKVAGHIPGAVNLPGAELTTAGGTLRPAEELRDVFARVGVRRDKPIGTYCGSGISAAQTALAMTVAGFPTPAVYVGSWSNWIADPARPTEPARAQPTPAA